ncbi:MAG TPA: heme ABC exporter ATP-binding protein CcmA, partial [Steroidobacteraceae bacterium]|nr:heme ABC exporter ATP-binding protein CcmA [Steroidobacteraceae bacterium]
NVNIHHNFANFSTDLAYLGHANALKTDLTALENLRFSGALKHGTDDQRCLRTLDELSIPQCAHLPVKALSAGQRRRVSLARVLISDTSLWILDEPITNLDTAGIQLVEELMASHLARGGMILTAAHQSLLPSHAGTRSLSLH